MTGSRLAVQWKSESFALDVDLAWEERVLVLFGESGAGKSMLLGAALGLVRGARARVNLGGAWLEDEGSGLRLAPWRRGLGWVPQDAVLFPHLTVQANLRFGLGRAPGERELARAIEVLGLAELLPRAVGTLSGGERQRVAIGRAVASGPRALLLDEPLAGVDHPRRARVLRHLLRVRDELRLPMVYVTHEPDEALLLGERVVVLESGRTVASGEPAEVLWSAAVLPLSERLGLENVIAGRGAAGPAGEPTLETPGGLRWVLPAPLAPGEAASLGLRAAEVLLSADPPGRVSARNVIPARVLSCERHGGDTFVHLATEPGGEPLCAKLTTGAAERLALAPGARVHALVKAQALRRLA